MLMDELSDVIEAGRLACWKGFVQVVLMVEMKVDWLVRISDSLKDY